MSHGVRSDSSRFANETFSLFKEFSAHLGQTRADAHRLHDQYTEIAERVAETPQQQSTRNRELDLTRQQYLLVQDSFRRIDPALVKLARQISQWLQHNEVSDDVDRIRIEARLAKFENEIQYTREILRILSTF
jgi:hypothetical protein